MKSLCKKININYDSVMQYSTYHGKSWWGDKVSGRDLNGVNPNFKKIILMRNFSLKRILNVLSTT